LLIKRPIRGKSSFKSGRDHLHHLLLDAGYKVKFVVLFLYGAAVLIGLAGLYAYFLNISEGVMFTLFMTLFVIHFICSPTLIRLSALKK